MSAVPMQRPASVDALAGEGFFDLLVDPACVCSLDGTFLRVNAAWTTVLGHELDLLTGGPFLAFVHPDDVDPTLRAMAVLRTGAPVGGFRNRYRHRDGSYRHLEWSGAVPAGRSVIVAVARDVTDEVRRTAGHAALHAAWLEVGAATTLASTASLLARHARRVLDGRAAHVHARPAGATPVEASDTAVTAADVDDPRDGSVLTAPLLSRSGRPAGWVEVHTDRPTDAVDEHLLQSFSRTASLAVERVAAEQQVAAALQRTTVLLDSVTDAFFLLDRQWRFTHLNSEAERVLRRPAAELLGRTVQDAFPHGDAFETHYRLAVETGSSVRFEAHYAPLETWFDVRVYPSDDGLAVYLLDAGERLAAAADLRRRYAQQEAVAALGQAATEGADRAALLRRAVADLTAVLEADTAVVVQAAPDGSLRELARSGPGPAAHELARRALFDGATAVEPADGQPDRVAVPVGRPGAWWGVVEVSRHGLDGGDLLFLRQVANVLSAAVERQHVEARVRHQAHHDALTALPNRLQLQQVLDDALSGGSPLPVGLLLLDLDGFKDVNDSLGHAAGDAALVQVADRLRTAAGASLVARLGGDEFAVCVSPCSTPAEAERVAERVLRAFDKPFVLPELTVALSASIGIAISPHDGTGRSALLSHADVAMYRAKTEGGSWRRYDTTLDTAQAERLTLVADLRRAVRAGEIGVHYQPVIDVRTGRARSYEALARWTNRGVEVPPAVFVALAEQTGLITELTRSVIATVREQAPGFLTPGGDERCAVNLSVVSLRNRAAATAVLAEVVAGRDVLSVEVTESALADETTQEAVRELADAGVRCSIDDFGTGYSSLAALKHLPATTVKIDRAFVRDICTRDVDLEIVRSVADLGRTLGLDVVAEGVETVEAAERLRDAGVELAQGYLYARPAEAGAVAVWARAQPPA